MTQATEFRPPAKNMPKSEFHSAYWAHELTLKDQADSIDKLSRSISNAKVDLNPHQVDAALFALRSPLSKGVILADEVGLGKTIEAGIVIAQKWAEKKRKILLILPATLRKQWQQELEEKFFIPSVILEASNFSKTSKANLFEQTDKAVICSYHFAANKHVLLRKVAWDLVVVDEAHRLRNVYKPTNKIAKNISESLEHAPKLLLTATPLQNSLLELFGLVGVIDPHVFGDIESFREQFVKASNEDIRNNTLKDRIKPFCTRTLRKQVLEYIRFTQRIPITQEFMPSDAEQELYEKVSAYLQRELLFGLPPSQRSLMTLVLRKLLASSSFAIAGTLRRIISRLEEPLPSADPLSDDDFESLAETRDEWEEDDEADPPDDAVARKLEISELKNYAELAENISQNAKGEALLSVLEKAFERAASLGAEQKAVIFTESRRTQKYLSELLSSNGYADQIVMINGTNTDPESKTIYAAWLDRNKGSSNVSGSKSADMKAALVEQFKERAAILLATESAAEGVNLQFSSLVVNYDLPWNPQRIEQRIGRCHRYGQKHDVVVVNFLNRKNEADRRVFQLLSEKFRLFDGVFGASDEVLGAIESGVDIEKRIAEVYQECRNPEEIQNAFDVLQAELEEKIQNRLLETRQALLENVDEDVHARLKMHKDNAIAVLSQRQQWLLSLTAYELAERVELDPSSLTVWSCLPSGYGVALLRYANLSCCQSELLPI